MKTLNGTSWLAVLASSLCITGLAATSALAQEQDEDAAELDRVVVTGSRISRTQVEGPSPVTVLSRDDIEREGFTTVYEALNTLTQNVGNTQGETTSNSFTLNAEVVDLRGLGPGRTLVLINGRRSADYPLPFNAENNFFNLASIPTAIVERIEVLAGGASAIYGSDAVAGVINIILRKDVTGLELNARLGDTTQGGGESMRFQAAGGFLRDRLSVTYAVEFFDRDRLDVRDRDYMDSELDNPAASGNPSASLVVADFFTGTRVNTGLQCDQFPELFQADLTAATTGLPGSQCGRFDDFEFRSTMRNDRESVSAYVNLSYELSAATELYGYTNYWTADGAGYSGLGSLWFSAAETGGGIFIDDDLFFGGPNPILGLAQRSFQPSEVPGGESFFDRRFEEDSLDIAVGVRGQLFDTLFEYDVTFSHAEYDYEERQNRLREEVVDGFFQGPLLGFVSGFPVYDFNYANFNAPLTPADVSALFGLSQVVADTSVDQATFVLTGDLFEMPAGPVGFAAVAEWASQDYQITPDARGSIDPGADNGWWGGSSTPVPSSDRDRVALGVELALPLAETVRATVAGRYDRYNDITQVDDAVTYNLGLEWRPYDTLLFRATNATSFRAPDMHLIFGESNFFIRGTDEYLCRRDEPGVPLALCTVPQINASGTLGGDANLREEEGESFTVGFVWEPITDLSVSVDYFEIELTNSVDSRSIGEILEIEADCRLGFTRAGEPTDINSGECQDALSRVSRRPPDPGQFSEAILNVRTNPINRASQTVDGYDATVEYRFDTRAGDFAFASQWSHVVDAETIQFAGDVPFTRDDLQNFDFRSRMRTSFSWTRNKWAVNVFQERVGSVPNWAETGRIGSHITYNTWTRYQLNDQIDFSLTVVNLFDTDPPLDPTYDDFPFFSPFNYSPIGREVFLQFDWRM